MKIGIGIDPGITGAIAVVEDTRLVSAISLPVKEIYKSNNKIQKIIDAEALYEYLMYVMARYVAHDVNFFIENVHAMPRQGVSSAFNFGRTFGIICACVEITGNSPWFVAPGTWKRYCGLTGKNKEASIRCAEDIFGHKLKPWKLKKHHDRAEAALIAHYGLAVLDD